MKKIPKKLYLYWDKKPMSKLQVYTLTTFHQLNDEWEIIVYLASVKKEYNYNYIPEYTGDDYFSEIYDMDYVTVKDIDLSIYGIDDKLHDILKSDIFRYHLLYNDGGVWSDFDVLWLKPFSSLSNIYFDGNVDITDATSFVCMSGTTKGFHNISIMMGTPGDSFILSLIDECNSIQEIIRNRPDDSYPIHQLFGTTMLNRLYPTFGDVLKKHNNTIALKYETFFPYHIYHLDDLYNKIKMENINENVMGVHWFNGHDLSKEYINNEDYTRECTMSKLIRGI